MVKVDVVCLLLVFHCLVCGVTLCLRLYVQLRGEFVRSVGSEGDGVGQFNLPSGLALSPDETRLLVIDEDNARVVVADATDGRWMHTLQGPAGTLVSPAGVAMVARTGQVLVVDWERGLVVVFAGVDDDTVVRTLGDGQLVESSDVAVLDEGDAADRPVAVVADMHNDRLSLIRVDDDTLLRHVGSAGAAPGQFDGPHTVSVVSSRLTGSGEAWLVVGDSGNCRVQVLTLLGDVVRVLAAGDGVAPLSKRLTGVTLCEATGEVLVSDSVNHRVVSWRLFDGGGCRVVCGTGEEGSGDGQLYWPVGVVTTSSGALWLADSHNHRLCLFR
jgi:tripartite motif-containing protein 71